MEDKLTQYVITLMNIKRVMGEVIEVEPVLDDDEKPIILAFNNLNKAIFRMRNLANKRQTFVVETVG